MDYSLLHTKNMPGAPVRGFSAGSFLIFTRKRATNRKKRNRENHLISFAKDEKEYQEIASLQIVKRLKKKKEKEKPSRSFIKY